MCFVSFRFVSFRFSLLSELTLHHFFESMKRAAADRAVWRRQEHAAGLLAKSYADERREGIGEGATPSATQAGGFRQGDSSNDAAGDPEDWLVRKTVFLF